MSDKNDNDKRKPDNAENIILPFSPTDSMKHTSGQPCDIPDKKLYAAVKRFFDIVLSLFALIILLPPMLVVAVAVKCSSKGSVFYRQVRLGKGGRPYKIIKFRTMYTDAEDNGIRWSEKDDDRVYPFGRFLRKYRIDELPQFLNCLSGKMSIVGPRPERPEYYAEFEKYMPDYSKRLFVKPGMTGYAVVKGGFYLTPEEKIRYDIEYMKKRSLLLDAKIFFSTFSLLLKAGKNNGYDA